MKDLKLFDAELSFMNIVWDSAPIKSTELVKLANEKLGWKKSTTYTVIRKLCKREILQNEHAEVTPLVEREQIQKRESTNHLNKMYKGSLKFFLASFLDKEKLTEEEALELKRIIDEKTATEE